MSMANFLALEFDISTEQAGAIQALMVIGNSAHHANKYMSTQVLGTMMSMIVTGMANGDAGVLDKLRRAVEHLMDTVDTIVDNKLKKERGQ